MTTKRLTMRTWAEISLDNIVHNMARIRAHLPEGTKFLGVVKADAYGHGAVRVARVLEKNGADYLAVSCLDEALELRGAGIAMPILILGHTPAKYVPLLIEQNLTQTVSCEAKAQEYSAAAQGHGQLRIHIKLDTGMSRLGFLCKGELFEQGVENVLSACACPHLEAEGIYTHFSVSDEESAESRERTREQLALFLRMIETLKARGQSFALRHCANSGAVVHLPESALDMVRPGLLLYGYGDGGSMGLKACMRLVSRVSTIKIYEAGEKISYGGIYETPCRSRLGVIPVGYADGLFRSLSNICAFHTTGGMAPQRGRICMDMCMIDLSELPQANVDSPVEIFGEQAPLETLARQAGTIPYELLCSVSKRVPRVYGDETEE